MEEKYQKDSSSLEPYPHYITQKMSFFGNCLPQLLLRNGRSHPPSKTLLNICHITLPSPGESKFISMHFMRSHATAQLYLHQHNVNCL